MIKLAPKYKPLFQNDTRYFVVTGGRGSSKSFSVSSAILLATFEKGNNVLYSRYTMVSASTSIIPEMVEKIELLGLEGSFKVNAREIINLQLFRLCIVLISLCHHFSDYIIAYEINS
jgi:phage terminase large subunit